MAWQLSFVMSLFLPLLGIATDGAMALVGYVGASTTQIYADPFWSKAYYLLLEYGSNAITAPYFYLAVRRAYGASVLAACLRSAALMIALFGATISFRFALFWLTHLSL